ncbi:P-loop containing nucleoside triphosphate hydrolase protein [Xylariaceae sp. FL1651]|nr:P-loop containing nucleoside triphosphate hydrolase protein [Xylariaceae sp. FL1651]
MPPKASSVPDVPRLTQNAETSLWFKEILARLESTAKGVPPGPTEKSEGPTEELTPSGLSCTVWNLYEGPTKCSCCFNWVEEYPNDAKEPIENSDKGKAHALVVRNKKGHGTKRPVVIHSIKIQSPLLRSILGDVFKGYPGITPGLKSLVFESPFRPFFYRLGELKAATKQHTDQKTVDHLELLYRTISEEMLDTLQGYEDMLAHGVITFAYVWTLFKPGDLVYSRVGGRDRVFLVSEETEQGQNSWEIPCKYIDWDGKKFGWDTDSLSICKFNGTARVTELAAYPLALHPHADQLRDRLLSRGRKFESLAGFHYMRYDGVAKQVDDMASIFGISSAVNNKNLTAEQLLICNSTQRGYCLGTKKWAAFEVDNVHEISWNEHAFSSLKLPGSHKEVFLALIKNQLQNQNGFDDVMQNKGKGVIFLLAGPPGVGKTLTAESILADILVADHIQAPLYSLTAGELGETARESETTFAKVFSVVTKWKAVLLLDEADVFLEQRTLDGLNRNRLVSVLLRMLEYFQGILFMTTNRIRAIDTAFESRIHITVNYPELTTDIRQAIWTNFASLSKQPVEISSQDLALLSETVMNGRQIKNAFKIATLLACHSGKPLTVEHIHKALQVVHALPGQSESPESIPNKVDLGKKRGMLENEDDDSEPKKRRA